MRRRLKQIGLGLLLLAGLYLLAVNLFLNTPLGPGAFNRRPQRFRIGWTAAWSFVPGRVDVRGLQINGHTRSMSWTITAERAGGWIDLPALFDRTFRVSELHAEGVRSQVLRGRGKGTAAHSPPPRVRRRRPWTLRFEKITLDHIREFRFSDFRLTGDGRGEGAFHTVFGGAFRLAPSKVRMTAGQLFQETGLIARGMNLQAEMSLGPYVVRRHPGLQGYDFLSGSLRAEGEVSDLPFLERRTRRGKPGRLQARLRVERGLLQADSRLVFSAPARGGVSPFIVIAAVAPGPVLSFNVAAKGLAVGRKTDGPPVLKSRILLVTSRTSETRLSRIFSTARSLRTRTALTPFPLMAEVWAEGLQVEARGARASLRATLDQARGRVDLAGLLGREIAVEGLQAEGVSARLDLATGSPALAAQPGATPPWSTRIAGARLSGIRELALGEHRLDGEATAEATFSYDRTGVLDVERAVIAMERARFRVNGEPAAQDLSLKFETRIEPSILGRVRGQEFFHYVSGTASLRGRISSLGFLKTYLEKAPWLALQGQGWLAADVRLDHGRLAPGSRLAMSASPARATIFDSLATGSGTVNAAVEPDKGGARTSLRVRFERFGLADPRKKGRPAYIRGRGLRIDAVAPGALDLTAPVPDFEASLDLPDAEVPDLSVYNALIPEATGLSILHGPGRIRMRLQTSTATRRAKGSVTLSSNAAKIQFQNLEMAGRLTLRAPLASPDLASRRFDLKGMRLDLDGVSYQDIEAEAAAEPSPWWMRAELDAGSMVWGVPLSLRGEGRIEMKNSGPLLTLFAQRSRFLRWFDDALNVENVKARGVLRLGNGVVAVESLQATGGSLELRSRMIFSKTQRRGDLYMRYGRLAAGIELQDGQRSVKLRRPLEWFESRRGSWKVP